MTINANNAGAVLFRVSFGVMLIAHGLLKVLVFTLHGTVGFFESVGLPGWLAYPVTTLEVAGGLLLVLGFWVRPITALSLPVLLGAAWVHSGNGWVFSNPNGGWEYPVFLAIAAIAIFLQNPRTRINA